MSQNANSDIEVREPAYLLIEKGNPLEARFEISGVQATVGNSQSSDITIQNPFVSRHHMCIKYSEFSYFITDLGSKNGTAIDQVVLNPNETRELEDGALISLAQDEVLIRFRRSNATLQQVKRPSSDLGLVVDSVSREVTIRGDVLIPPLSRREFDVISILFENRGQAIHRDRIANHGWPERLQGDVGNQEIEQCISRLRRRLENDPTRPEFIVTLRGYGYKMP